MTEVDQRFVTVADIRAAVEGRETDLLDALNIDGDAPHRRRRWSTKITISTLDVAREYCRRGWRVVPIPAGRKGPVMRAWQDFEATSDDLPELDAAECWWAEQWADLQVQRRA